MNICWKKSVIGAMAALSLGLTFSTPASAWGYGYGWGPGPAIGAAIVGGAVVGAAVAGANRGPDEGDCGSERRPVYDEYGNPIGRRRVRVCR